MRIEQIIFFLLAVGVSVGHAQEDTGRVKGLMHSFVTELSKMSPYLTSEEAFLSPAGKKTVRSSLVILNRKVRNPPPEIKNSTGFKITFGLLADQISTTKTIYEKGEYEYARMRLNGLTNLCASCHTQTPKLSRGSPFLSAQGLGPKPTFEGTNFLFVIRRYDEALAGFDKLVRGYPNSGLASAKLQEVYRRKLAIFARVKRDPKMAAANLREDLKNPNLPVDVKANVKDWIVNFDKWAAESQDPGQLTTSKLIEFVANKIPPSLNRRIAPSDPELMNLLRLSGLLYERLYSESDPDLTQQLLYYLAACERSLSPLNWYSLNEIYLKECVVKYPKKPFSKKCFDAYRMGMEERYSDKGMPDYIQGSIDALKEYL